MHLLQLFYQHKHEACLEDDIERLQNCIGTVLHRQDDIDQLIKQLKEWMSEMVKNGLLEHNFIAIETSEKSWNLLIEVYIYSRKIFDIFIITNSSMITEAM